MCGLYECVVHEQCVHTYMFGVCFACVCISGGASVACKCWSHVCIFGVSHSISRTYMSLVCAYECPSTKKVLPAVRRGPALGEDGGGEDGTGRRGLGQSSGLYSRAGSC